jgi:CBS domain-containing protein
MKTVLDLISGHELFVISKKQTVVEAAQLMSAKNIGAAPVVENDRVVGIFSERDIMNRVVAKNLDPQKTTVEQVMTKDLIVATPSETIDQAEARMKQHNIRHLPVVTEDRLVGIVSLRDLIEADLDEKHQELQIMSAYIHYIPPNLA